MSKPTTRNDRMLGPNTSLGLFILPLLLIAGIGGFLNNLSSSGISGTPSLTCNTYGQCYDSGTTGCGSAPASCNVTSSITFLNPHSAFTYLFTGDILGFVSSFYPINSGYTIVTAQPQFPFTNTTTLSYPHTLNGSANKGIAYCFDVPSNQNTILNPISSFIYNCEISSYPIFGDSKWIWGIKCSPLPLTPSTGCGYIQMAKDPYNGTTGTPSNWRKNDTAFWMANVGGSGPFCPFGQISDGGYYIFGASPLGSTVPYNATYKYAFGLTFYGCVSTGATASPLNFLSILGFILGIGLLIILVLGIGFDSGALTFNWGIQTNPQGTRLVQTVGIYLVLWIPIWSEFGSVVLSPANLPNGLWAVISFIVLAFTFFGLYERL